jgi:hypothetical protein
VSEEVLVHLIFDPYRIYAGEGQRVTQLEEELAAFRAIGDVLRQDPDTATRRPRTYVLDRTAWEHFRSIRAAKGVRIREYTPRREVQALLGSEPPTWLSDEVIVTWDLLHRPGPLGLVQEDWAATLASWLFPGITEAASLGEWLLAAASAPELAGPIDAPPLMDWLAERLRSLATQVIPVSEVVADLAEQLRASGAPIPFARSWVRRKALLPLTRPGANKPLTVPGLSSDAALDLARANYLPELFPLPQPLQSDVSHLMSEAVKIAQLERPDTFEPAVLSLNALWEGVAEELDRWLQVNPRGMTEQAARHLAGLAGFEGNELAEQLIRQFAPPAPVTRWTDLDDSFDDWVNAYAIYIERLFYRRTLPAAGEDPAQPFARWVKANPTVFFNHPERGYFCVAGLIQQAMQAGRAVIVVLVDALAVHVAAPALAAFERQLAEPPTRLRYCFSPVPTISKVCKEAILGGALPEACYGNLQQTLERRYGLTGDQLQLAGDWQDAERIRVSRQVRLLVYRDNRLDNQLPMLTSYRTLRESFEPIITFVARLVGRWAEEFRHWHGSLPLIILTGDHGFTYGPKVGQETAARRLDGPHRCVDLGEDRPEDSELGDESLTFLDPETFHLRSGYLVARGRTFGKGTMSGWALSHGGLLPEEVIIPVAEWFGDRQTLAYPDVSVPAGAVRDRGRWLVTLELRNNQPVPTAGGRLRVTLAGEGMGPTTTYPALRLGSSHHLVLEVPGPDPMGVQEVVLEVTLSARASADAEAPDLVRHIPVRRVKQFVERTEDQAAFEDMF